MSLLLRIDPRLPAVTRLRAGETTDFDGDPVESWAPEDVVRLPLPNAKVEVRDVTEDDGITRRVIRREWVLFAPGAPDVRDDDRIEVDGETFRVNGPPIVRHGVALGTETTAALERITAAR